MSIVIDANMKLFAERLNITSSRMVEDYGLKTVDEIIEAEAAQGNMKAVNYAREMYNSPAKLVKIFRLADVENKYAIIHAFDSKTREEILPLLDKEDLVMGLYFFTQEGLLKMLCSVDIEELVNVILMAFPLPEIIMMFKEEDLAMFFQNDQIEKYVILNEIKNMPPDVMMKFVESVTGQAYDHQKAHQLLMNLESMPEDKFRDFMSMVDPEFQRQVIFQLTKKEPEYLQLFNRYTYIDMLDKLMKPEMVKPMIALEQDTLVNMITQLPPDLMSIVAAQIDTKTFADYLLDGHLDVLENALMI